MAETGVGDPGDGRLVDIPQNPHQPESLGQSGAIGPGVLVGRNSKVCDHNAEEIIRNLGIKQPDIPEWLKELLNKLEAVDGDRRTGDAAETAAPSDPSPPTDKDDSEPFDGEAVPH